MSTDVRTRIEKIVHEYGGLRFSTLKDEIGRENGVIQYHVHRSDAIEHRCSVIVAKDFCRDCALAEHCTDKCILPLLRNPVKRAIVDGLADGKSQKQLAGELDLDKSTISYHVKTLTENGVLNDKQPVDAVTRVLTDS